MQDYRMCSFSAFAVELRLLPCLLLAGNITSGASSTLIADLERHEQPTCSTEFSLLRHGFPDLTPSNLV
jgi:hypothetical protein